MVGIAVITHERPEYFSQTIKAVLKHLTVDELVVVHSGNDNGYNIPKEVNYIRNTGDSWVAINKNLGLKHLIDKGCTHLFTLEDDVYPTSQEAITGYIKAAETSGFHHLNFAHHGGGNDDGPIYADSVLSYYLNCIGAYSYYTKEVIEKCGYLDENFRNAYEHVEHYARIAREHMTSPFWLFADATGSEKWLSEIKGSIDNSAIRPRKDWKENIEKALAYWKEKDGVGLPPTPFAP